MAGSIVLVTCLLAICLPIVFVQFSRFNFIKEQRAEFDSETRPTLLRRRSISPSRKTLRRSIRFKPETEVDDASAESKQRQDIPEQVAQAVARRQWHTSFPRPFFQGDASTDGAPSSREEDEAKGVRAGRAPWNPLLGRHARIMVSSKGSQGGQGHTVAVTSPFRKTGRDLEARGVATRLFPPDPVPDMELMDENDQSSSMSIPESRQPLHSRLALMNQPQVHGSKRQAPARKQQSTPPKVGRNPSRSTDSNSPPSLFDGPPLPSACHSPDVPRAGQEKHSCCHNRHCRNDRSCAGLPHASSNLIATTRGDSRGVLTGRLRSESTETALVDSKQTQKGDSGAVGKAYERSIVPWRALLLLMGLIVFIFAFAVLVAHCLAWFLVYKTEARLGEVRSGLLRGGEMKLCLCGKG